MLRACLVGLLLVASPAFAQADLDDDWVLTHEMIHFGFPSVEQRHHWIGEGIATYAEPIAPAQVRRLTAERVWREMVDGMTLEKLQELTEPKLQLAPSWQALEPPAARAA